MTFLEYCEYIYKQLNDNKPLSNLQKDYILQIQDAIESGKKLKDIPRGNAKIDARLVIMAMYAEWKSMR